MPMPAELAAEFRRYPAVLGEDRIFPPQPGAKRERQRVDKSFATILELASIENFRFHDLRHRADSPVMPTVSKEIRLPRVWRGVPCLAYRWKSA